MIPKYEPLADFLQARKLNEKIVTLTFRQIEQLIGAPLPNSAYEHQAWWGNQRDTTNRPQARAWMSTGFLVAAVHQQRGDGWVRFGRR